MALKPTEKIWHNGKLIRWEDATIHVLSHVVSYGSAVFEGLRCYETKNGPAIFRVREHMQRMINSGKIYRIEWPYTADDLSNAAAEVVRANKMNSCYIRPIALRGYGDMGVGGLNVPTEVYMACWEWGRYLGPEAIENGVDVCVSSWNRMAPNTLPSMAKAAANYMNSQLIHMEAHANGYSEGIALDTEWFCQRRLGGKHLRRDGRRVDHATDGIERPAGHYPKFRDDAVRGPKNPGARANDSSRDALLADEVFFTGTAAEITPLRSVDRIKVGKGTRGPITKALQEEFFAILNGSRPDRHNWLTPVSVPLGAGSR